MDTSIVLWLHDNIPGTAGYKLLFAGFTGLGSGMTVLLVVIITALIFLFLGRLHKAHIILLSAIISAIVASIVKYTIARPRPEFAFAGEIPTSYSFPSGHALVTIVVYGVLAYFLAERYPRRKAIIYILCAVGLFLVGLSRLYLAVHWPTDIIGGWIIGAIILAAMVWWYHKGSLTRMLRIILGVVALVLGLLGLIIPIFPGIPLIIAGGFLIFSGRPLRKMSSA